MTLRAQWGVGVSRPLVTGRTPRSGPALRRGRVIGGGTLAGWLLVLIIVIIVLAVIGGGSRFRGRR